MSNLKIAKLEIENVKRVKAVKIVPTRNGLTILGGKNKQGKTSVLDAIAWALGGDRFRPSKPTRDGSVIPPNLSITMSNGLVVERKGKNSDLKVTDPNGQKAGQQLLNSFVEELAIDLPKFMESSNKEKANILLQIIGVGQQLLLLENEESEIYNNRRAIGQIKDQKQKFAKEQIYHPEAPKELISASDLIKQQQEILARNGENQKKRENVTHYKNQVSVMQGQVDQLKKQLIEAELKLETAQTDLKIAETSALDLLDESTDELEANLQKIEEINRLVRDNLDKDKAEEDAEEYRKQYDELSIKLDKIRQTKTDLLNGADLPLPGLSVEDGELIYLGQKWDNMSGAEQLKVSTAIVRKLKPQCGFILLDKLEQMDLETLEEFGAWLEAEGLQAIATRVSTGEECSIIIEDGYAVGQELPDSTIPAAVEDKKEGWSF